MPQVLPLEKNIRHGREADPSFPETTPAHNFRLQVLSFSKIKLLTDTYLPARTNETFPFVRLLAELPGEQRLYSSLQKISCRPVAQADWLRSDPPPPPVESRRKHARIVKHHQ